jgi:hypothetical protein
LKIIEIQSGALMRCGGCIDDACGFQGQKPLPQTLRHNKIRHVIKREGGLKPIFRQPSSAEQCPCIVDQNVDRRLPVSDFGTHPFHFGQACEIGKIYGVGYTGSASTEPRQSRFRARLTPRDQDDTGAHPSECFRSDFANS